MNEVRTWDGGARVRARVGAERRRFLPGREAEAELAYRTSLVMEEVQGVCSGERVSVRLVE